MHTVVNRLFLVGMLTLTAIAEAKASAQVAPVVRRSKGRPKSTRSR